MRIAVVGGTGLVGRSTVDVLRRSGHDVVVVARSQGVDVTTGQGLAQALAGVDSVIDVTNAGTRDRDETLRFFESCASHLASAEERAGIKHHLLLSILNVDRYEGNAHLAGKRLQEKIVTSGRVPWTILRAAQFHEFAGMVVDWSREGDTARVAPMLLQPIAVDEVAKVLAEIAVSPPQRRKIDLAGPQPEDMVDMAKRTMAARGESIRIIPTWRGGIFGPELAGEIMLPGPDARLGSVSFDAWLAGRR
jgi:uncharacterized protein YbjT (DUF2867 family)